MKHLYALVAILVYTAIGNAQCLTNVDFNTWSEAGYPANGNWVVQAGGNQVRQTVNGNPTYFVSPFDLINVSITGDFRTTNSDDDMMGFVFCFKNPFGASDTTVTWLFDWKRGQQASGAYTAEAGMSVNNINGIIPTSAYAQTFWGHQNTPDFTCVANNFPSAGWVQNQTHTFQLDLSYTRATIYIDGVLKFDIYDCFTPGRFGFYNYSQQDCYYSNFQYTMNVGFSVAHQQTCMGDSAVFNFLQPCSGANFGLAQYQSLRWDYGDGTIVTNNTPTLQNVNSGHIYNTPGTYNVQLIVTDVNGCSDTANEQVVITPKPVAAFSAPGACLGTAVQFTDQTTGSSNSWNWDFGNGNTSTLQNPSFDLGAVGQYPITLYIEDTVGCKDTVTQNASVFALPTAAFNTDTVCQGSSTSFTNASSSDVTTWQWNYGDGGTSNTANTYHTYAAAGSYTTTLIVNTVNSCADTAIAQVPVNPNPVAAFTASTECYPAATQFTNQTTGGQNYIWLFGDGATDNQINTNHVYTAGSYTATLIAVSSVACADTISQTITVNPKPTAAFAAPAVCVGAASTFTAGATVSTGNITNYYWAFGDGSTDLTQNPSHTYALADTFYATLAVQTDQGCLDTLSQAVVVHPAPVAAFTAGAVCLNQTNTFADASTVTSGSISQWAWDFGDAQGSNSQNASHTYAAQGNYTINLVVATTYGCTDSTNQSITVFDKPVAAFTASEECQGVATQFTDASSIGNGSLSQWTYYFADGNSSNQQNTSHLYLNAGTYAAYLVATSTDGCSDTATQTTTVNPRTQIAFNFSNVCHGNNASFTNQSTIATGTVAAWQWQFGDGNTANTQNSGNLYSQPGIYQVQLKATSDKGCEDSLSQNITVYTLPIASTSITPACYGQANGTATVNASSGTPGYSYYWNNGTGSAYNPDLLAGTYTVTVIDFNNCSTSASAIVHEPAGPLTLSTTPSPINIELNESVTVNFNNSYNATVSYSVEPSYGLSCTNCSTFSAQPYKTTEYFVDLTDSLGCTGTGKFSIIVDQSIPVFIPNAFSPNGDGQNDVWTVYTQALYRQKVQVYNRIGELVFESEDDKIAWDGNYKGEPLPNGVYTYVISFQWLNQTAETNKTGSIQLLR